MSHAPLARGVLAARGRAGADGPLPWLVEVSFALSGLDAVGELLGLLTEGLGSAARDAAWDAGAGALCTLVMPFALALGLHDLPLGDVEANLVALVAKAWAPHALALVPCVVACAVAAAYLNGALLATTNAAQANSANSSVQYNPSMNRSNRPVAAGSVLRLRTYCIRWWMLPCSQLCSDSTMPSTA